MMVRNLCLILVLSPLLDFALFTSLGRARGGLAISFRISVLILCFCLSFLTSLFQWKILAIWSNNSTSLSLFWTAISFSLRFVVVLPFRLVLLLLLCSVEITILLLPNENM